MKAKEDKDAAEYKERLELQHKITKINLLIPQVMDGYCKIKKTLTTIGARSRTESWETTMGLFCADALNMVKHKMRKDNSYQSLVTSITRKKTVQKLMKK